MRRPAPAEIDTEMLSRVAQRGPASAAAVGFDGHRQQASRKLVFTWRHRHRELASGSGVHLGGAAGARASLASGPLV